MKKCRRIVSALFLSALVSGVVTSCGNSKKSEEGYTLSPETTAVKGDLSDYYEVVSKEYTTSNGIFSDNILSVEVRRTDKEFDFDPETTKPMGTVSVGMTGNAGFGIEVLDEAGNVVTKASANVGGLGGMYSDADMTDALKLKPGETATVRWGLDFDDGAKPTTFRITSAYEKHGSDESSSGLSSSSSSSSSDDWDSILNTYENYVDQYIGVYKKVQNGDVSAAMEMGTMLEKAEELQEKLENAESQLSTSQASRLAKINAKLLQAL